METTENPNLGQIKTDICWNNTNAKDVTQIARIA